VPFCSALSLPYQEALFPSKKSLQVEDIQVCQFGPGDLYNVLKFSPWAIGSHRRLKWFDLSLHMRMKTRVIVGPVHVLCIYTNVFLLIRGTVLWYCYIHIFCMHFM
jgi:hypothetical protein